jgi:preprotein translocase subunit SecF
MINFLRYSKFYLFFTVIILILSVAVIGIFGLKAGIEFTGGSILEVKYLSDTPSEDLIRKNVSELNLGEFSIQHGENNSIIIRMVSLDEKQHQSVIEKLKELGNLEELRFDSIGPVIGKELREKVILMIFLSLLAIVIYISLAFRRVSFPIKSWQYSLVSLFILFHDIIVTLGIFALLGKFYAVQITIPVVIALLTVLGYSINNTVIVFDRIRENLIKRVGVDYVDSVNISINQTLSRSLNTSLTTLLVLFALYFFGGDTLKYFTLALILGIILGTYSSILVAGSILVFWYRRRFKP